MLENFPETYGKQCDFNSPQVVVAPKNIDHDFSWKWCLIKVCEQKQP